MKDLIDERNERERIHNSIVKFWNVNYIPTPVEKPASEAESETAVAQPGSSVVPEAEVHEELYNESTGSYSGLYGADAENVDEVTRGQIDQILSEKDEHLREIIKSEGGSPS